MSPAAPKLQQKPVPQNSTNININNSNNNNNISNHNNNNNSNANNTSVYINISNSSSNKNKINNDDIDSNCSNSSSTFSTGSHGSLSPSSSAPLLRNISEKRDGKTDISGPPVTQTGATSKYFNKLNLIRPRLSMIRQSVDEEAILDAITGMKSGEYICACVWEG